jgi:hypothetical protein
MGGWLNWSPVIGMLCKFENLSRVGLVGDEKSDSFRIKKEEIELVLKGLEAREKKQKDKGGVISLCTSKPKRQT